MHTPKINEIWTINGKEAIVLDATEISKDVFSVKFVSLTGHRCTVRLMDVVAATYQFKGLPTAVQNCSSMNCTRGAFISYNRTGENFPEVVCPTHIPQGTISTIIKEPISATRFEPSVCACGGDATEVLNVVSIAFPTTMWHCQTCNKWWLQINDEDIVASPIITPQLRVLQNRDNLRVLVPQGYCMENFYLEPEYRRTRIYINPDVNTKIEETKTTIYDYIMADRLDI